MKETLNYDDLLYAWKRASQGKKKRKEVQERMEHFEHNMKQLWNDIVTWTYQIWRTKRYIVQDPVVRELVVIPFRDRIVQHLISYYLTPLFEKQFIHDNYANRVGRGCLFGIRRVDHMIRSLSRNYTRETRVLKCDIQSCFMSIDRKLVLDLITRRIFTERVERSKSLVLWLVQKSLFNDYVTDRQDCTKHEQRMLLPNNKSMKACQLWCGLPLWNLTSHLFAQIVLHELDLFVKHDLKIKWYGRYVDDFVLIHNDRDYLKWCIHRINIFLKEQLGLVLHPQKIYFQPVTVWVPFLWVYIKPRCRLIWKRTLCKIEKKLKDIDTKTHSIEYGSILRAMLNSYFGMISHHDSLRIRKSFLSWLPPFRYNDLRPRKWYASVVPRRRLL
jgi:RNA-directed DNA polymerase